MNHYATYGNHAGLGILGGIFSGIFWVLIIVLLILVIRRLAMGGHMHRWGNFPHQRDALDILKERYAKGEINKQEFEEKKKDLS